jgi:HAD superfamily hydrolase (TIGR01509 family)
MAKLEALLFDVDGTLADTEKDGHRIAFNRAFQQAGLDWDWTVPLYGDLLAVTGGKERILYFINNFLNDFKFDGDTSKFIAGLHATKTKIYTEMLAQGAIPLRNGVERLLHEAMEQGIKLGIATTTTPENVIALIENTLGTDAIKWFDVIAAGDVVPRKKPAPDIYFYAMEQLGLTAQQCLAFEDSENGIRATTEAGLKTVVTINDYTFDHEFSNAVLVLDQFGEPDNPFQVLKGDAGSYNYFTVDLARKLNLDLA